MELATSLNQMIIRKPDYHHQREKRVLEDMRLLNEVGYKVLDWNACDYVKTKELDQMTDLAVDNWKDVIYEMRNLAEKLGIRFNQAHGLIFNYFENSEKTEYLKMMAHRVMEACHLLGISRIIYHPEVPAGLREAKDIEGCRIANASFLVCEAEKAAAYNLDIAVENMFITKRTDGTEYWRYCSSPEELIDLVNTINRPNVCVCMDVGHAHIMKENLGDSISQYGSLLQALHIADNDRSSDQHLMPFHGSIDWKNLMRGLAINHYAGEFTYEIHKSTINMPAQLRPLMLRENYEVGCYLIQLYEMYLSNEPVTATINLM